MYIVALFILSFLQGESALLPVITPAPRFSPADPAAPVKPATAETEIHISGMLELYKHNHVVLAAPERAVLMSLSAEVKDAAGKITLIPVTEGMYVSKGQILGSFDDRELVSQRKISEAQLELAKAERDKKIEIEYAQRGMQVAEAEVRMMQDANKRREGTFPAIDVLKAVLNFKQAEANLALQTYTINEEKTREVTVRENELDRVKVLISIRKIVTPIDGMIVKVSQSEGEWMREGDPVLEIVDLRTLRFRGAVDSKYATAGLTGRPAVVSITGAGGEGFSGKVVFENPKVEAKDKYDIEIEITNKRLGNSWMLLPGHDATATIQLQ